MFVVICNQYNEAKKFIQDMYIKSNLRFCVIETEYGINSINEKNIGVELSLNHHQNSDTKFQPSLAYKHPKLVENRYENFLISHIDADTIFGIAWASGFFPKNKNFIEVSKLISQIDLRGFHNVSIPLKYKKIIPCIFSVVNTCKKLRDKSSNICTKEVRKAILKIKDLFFDKVYLELRYSRLIEGVNKLIIKKDNISNEKVSVYTKRFTDFSKDNCEFIINYTGTVSVFAKNEEVVFKYFDNGLYAVLQGYFGSLSGGNITSAGSGRIKNIDKKEFFTFVKWFKNEINKRS